MEVSKRDNWLEAIKWLCQYHEVRCHPVKIVSGLPLDDGQLSEPLFLRALESTPLVALELNAREVAKASTPFVMIDSNYNKPLIITKVTGQRVTLLDVAEEFKQREVTLDALRQMSKATLWQVSGDSTIDSRVDELKPSTPTSWLWKTIKEVRPWYRDLLVASFVINLLALIVPLFTMNVYDRVVPNQAMSTLWVLAAGVMIVVVFDWILKEARSSVTDMAGRYIDNKLSATLFSKTIGMKLENRPQSTGAFARQLQDFDAVKEFFTSVTLVTLVDLPFTFLFLVLIGWLGGA